MFDTTIHKTQDKDKQNKNTTQYVFDTTIRNQTQITIQTKYITVNVFI